MYTRLLAASGQNRTMRQVLLTFLLTILLTSCSGQEPGSWQGLRNGVTEYTLVDNELRMKFVLDSARINISAYDFSGNMIWRTDPWLDNRLVVHNRVKRPTIVYYSFLSQGLDNKEVISISYSSKQFGNVDRRTGKFQNLGKD
jgi:hypothetical protein